MMSRDNIRVEIHNEDVTMSKAKVKQENILLGLNARMGNFVNVMANRDDLVSAASREVNSKGKKHPAAAYFVPAHAQVYFDTKKFFADDEAAQWVDPYNVYDRTTHVAFIGAAVHEASHAQHTKLVIPVGTSAEVARWMTLLEESRCEGKHLEARPQDAPLLRGTLEKIVAPSVFKPSVDSNEMTKHQAAELCALVLARVTTGVVDASDVDEVRKEIGQVLGADVLDSLELIWTEAQAVEDGDNDSLRECAIRWVDTLSHSKDNDTSDQGESGDQGDSAESGESGESGESSESGKSGNQEDSADAGEAGENASNEAAQDDSENTPPGDNPSSASTADSDAEGTDDESAEEDDDSSSGKGAATDTNDVGSDGASDDASDEKPSEPVASRLPCGSWTPGELPEEEDQDSDDDAGNSDDASNDEESDEDIDSDIARAMKNLFKKNNESAVSDILEDAADASTSSRMPRGNLDKKKKEQAEAKAATQASKKVFGDPNPHAGSRAKDLFMVSNSKPTSNDKIQARALMNALRKAQYRDVSRTLIPSEAPPGRMRMSEVARRDAQVQRGDTVNATPWRQTRRREVQSPPFTLGVSIDVSGSLAHIQRPVSSVAWALTQATKHVNGKVAVAAWSNDVFPVIKPGRFPENVPVAKCGGLSGGCALSILALEGALGLSRAEGVRMMVIVSDGDISNRPQVQKQVDTLHRKGVMVIWAGVPRDAWFTQRSPVWYPENVTFLQIEDMDKFGHMLGKTLVDALSKYNR